MKKKELTENTESKGIFLSANRRIGSCMTHRPDIIWIDSRMKQEEILRLVRQYPLFNFFPVCSETVDAVSGVLRVRDFLESLLETPWPGLKNLVKKPVYLPETVTILKALENLQNTDCRMAFIIDEYGGIEGLVTRNSLVNELLEEVSPLTEEDADMFRREDGSWLIGGQVRMEELADQFKLPPLENTHDYHTLAGYILSVKGSIPHTGDRIPCGRYLCEIVDMDGHRIDKVLISELPDETAEP